MLETESYIRPSAESKQKNRITLLLLAKIPAGKTAATELTLRATEVETSADIPDVMLKATTVSLSEDEPPRGGIPPQDIDTVRVEAEIEAGLKVVAPIPLPSNWIGFEKMVILGETPAREARIAELRAVRAVLFITRPVRAERLAIEEIVESDLAVVVACEKISRTLPCLSVFGFLTSNGLDFKMFCPQ